MTLFRVLHAEVLKMRRTIAWKMAVFAPGIVVVLAFFAAWQAPFSTISRFGPAQEWAALTRFCMRLWAILMLPLYIVLQSALLAGLDHAGGQWRSILARPLPRWTFYARRERVSGSRHRARRSDPAAPATRGRVRVADSLEYDPSQLRRGFRTRVRGARDPELDQPAMAIVLRGDGCRDCAARARRFRWCRWPIDRQFAPVRPVCPTDAHHGAQRGEYRGWAANQCRLRRPGRHRRGNRFLPARSELTSTTARRRAVKIAATRNGENGPA